jgi:hypothetical protein
VAGSLSFSDTLLREEAEQNRLAGSGRAPLQTKKLRAVQVGAIKGVAEKSKIRMHLPQFGQ